MNDPDRVMEWLLAIGRRDPGMVLHPTCDDLAWLISRNAEILSRCFRLYTPPVAAVRALVDKSQLYAACAELGIATPRTWLPTNAAEVTQVASTGGMLIVKPRSQVFFPSRTRGELSDGCTNAIPAWHALRAVSHASAVRADMPDIDLPMVQEYLPSAALGVYSVTGFVDRTGAIHGALGAVKVLQQPRHVGVGLCFEAAPAMPHLVVQLRELANHVGYFGMFEAEFVSDGDRLLLIDFNPRYYHQMGFDIARGSPLPWMLHLGAIGRERDIPSAAAEFVGTPRAFQDRISLEWLFALGQATRSVDASEARRWRAWRKRLGNQAIDAVLSARDPMPGAVAALAKIYTAAVHPRSTFKGLHRLAKPATA